MDVDEAKDARQQQQHGERRGDGGRGGAQRRGEAYTWITSTSVGDPATADEWDEYLFFTGGVGETAGTEWTRPFTAKGQKTGELVIGVTVPEVAPAADDTLTIKVSDASNPGRSVSLTITGAEAAVPAGPGLPHKATLDLAGVLPADELVVSISAQQSSSEGVHGAFAVDYLEGTLSANGVDTFAYDGAGRMTSRNVDGVTTALTWDVTSSLVESNGQGGHVVYAYDASGQRVAQARVADANGVGSATAYVASGQVDDPNTATTNTGDLTATRYYTFGGSTVAIRTNDGQLSLMMGDEQGSTNVMMPVHVVADGNGTTAHLAPATLADAAAITRTSYTPYGELRGADNTATDRGWLGQVEDRVDGATGTGLTYLNARYYDPTTMRFISPDPLRDLARPESFDSYAYAFDNPVVFMDASGLFGWSDVGNFVKDAASATGDWVSDHKTAIIVGVAVAAAVVITVASCGAAAPALAAAAGAVMSAGAVGTGMAAAGTMIVVTGTTATAVSAVVLGVTAGYATDRYIHSNLTGFNRVSDAANSGINAGAAAGGTVEAVMALPSIARSANAIFSGRAGATGSGGAPAPTVESAQQRIQATTNQVAREFDDQTLKLTANQQRAVNANERLEPMFRGYNIDREVKMRLANDPIVTSVTSITRPGQKGPDFNILAAFRPQKTSPAWMDITTSGQWGAHQDRYKTLGTGLHVLLK